MFRPKCSHPAVFVLTLMGFAFVNDVSAQQGACQEVYKTATRNYDESRVNEIQKWEMFDRICTASGETNNTALQHDGSWTGYGIMESNWDFRQDRQRWQQFCQEGARASDTRKRTLTIRDHAAIEALGSFNQCLALQAQNLLIIPDATLDHAVINIQLRSNITRPFLDSVVTSSNMKCSSASLGGGRAKTLKGSLHIPIVQDFSIECERKSAKVRGNEFYKRGEVLLSTSLGPYKFVMPEDEHFGFWTASENERAFRNIEGERDAAIRAGKEREAALLRREPSTRLVCNGSSRSHMQDVSVPTTCPADMKIMPAKDSTDLRIFAGQGGRSGIGWKCILCATVVDPPK